MGFNHPSKIQETAIPSLLADPPINMIAQSQSGTGKTAAFSVAMLSRVDNNLSYPQALLLSPTYELALQTGKVIETMAKYYTNFKARRMLIKICRLFLWWGGTNVMTPAFIANFATLHPRYP